MTETVRGGTPLTAGERLVASSRPLRPARPSGRVPVPTRPRPRRGGGFLRRLLGVGLTLLVLGVAAAGAGGWAAWKHYSEDLPDVEALRHYQPKVMSRVYAGDSRLIAELATERRVFVPIAAVPNLVKWAFISAEDQNFYVHRGVDPGAIIRAGLTDLAQYGKGKRPVGASTITQQVAKNMLLGNELSLSRKAREAILAIRIDEALSKERVLELYLNEIYLGQSAYGVAAAAQTYFNKSLDELMPAEAAFLAALPKAPNNYNPQKFPEAARLRRDWVLDRMADDKVISTAEAGEAKAGPIVTAAFRRPETAPGADWFAEEVRRQLIDRVGADATTSGGLMVRTSLDPALQETADRVLREGLIRYDQRHGGWRGPVARTPGGPALHTGWPTALSGIARPPGMLPGWRLAIVIETTDAEARLGFQDTATGTPTPRTLPVQLADLAWARPVKDGNPGPSPRRLTDVLAAGDVVMVEPVAASTGKPARPERLLLRQIPDVQGALVSVEPATGRVVAMSGGWSAEMSQFNRATQASRQPGSSFKPMVYLAAMEKNISPSQRVLDAPFVLDQGAAGRWRPGNFGGDFSGPVPVHVALEKSLNLVTVRLAQAVGMDAVSDVATAFHVVDSMPKVLPASLGAVDTTVLRQAAAYAALAAGGREILPTVIDSIQDRDGHITYAAPGVVCEACGDPSRPPSLVDQRRQIADPASVFQVVTMMQGVVARGTGFAAGKDLGRPVAGKTGTTQDFFDAWFVGFTPELATAVWIGFDTPASLGEKETGGSIAAPIWHDFSVAALRGRPVQKFLTPPGVNLTQWDSGFGSVTDAFKPGQEPGASGPLIGGEDRPADEGDAAVASAPAAGVDSGLGGLY